MAAMSDFLENKIIDQVFRGQAYAFPATLYVGLYSAAPVDAGGGTELSGNNYTRTSIPASLANWAGTQATGSTIASTGVVGTTSNNTQITFPIPSAAWGVVLAFGIFDAPSAGNLLFYGALAINKTVNQGDIVTFPAASLSVQIDN